MGWETVAQDAHRGIKGSTVGVRHQTLRCCTDVTWKTCQCHCDNMLKCWWYPNTRIPTSIINGLWVSRLLHTCYVSLRMGLGPETLCQHPCTLGAGIWIVLSHKNCLCLTEKICLFSSYPIHFPFYFHSPNSSLFFESPVLTKFPVPMQR